MEGREGGREEMKVAPGMSFVWKQLAPLGFFRMPTAHCSITNVCSLLPISLVSTWWTCPQNKATSVMESGGLTLMYAVDNIILTRACSWAEGRTYQVTPSQECPGSTPWGLQGVAAYEVCLEKVQTLLI